jgi:hypothetical protein
MKDANLLSTMKLRSQLVPPGGYIIVKGANKITFFNLGLIYSLTAGVAKAVSKVVVP